MPSLLDVAPDQHPVTRPATAAAPAPVLRCDGLTFAYKDTPVVKELTFEVRPGEAYGLLGPNGAGKTTTIRMVGGMVEPGSGSVVITGGGPLGYVPQDLAVYPTLTLAENLRFWATMQGIGRRDRRARVDEALAEVGLTDRAGDRFDHCSGGMQRRLNLAVALLARPPLLVLDEPTVGVDPQSRAAVRAALSRRRDDGTAILYTSHDMDEVTRLCDRVGILDHGQLLAEGPPADLVASRPGAGDLEGLFLELTGRALRD
jgi:ABC-2 type transport system ATP-binding protein